ncbi:hypothetical protein IFM89_000932, partial [Coptis chinensis]
MASVVYITDDATGFPIDDNDRLSNIKKLLRYVLKGNRDKRYANTTVTTGGTHTKRRLHQMMYADHDYEWCDDDDVSSVSDRSKPLVTLENIADKGYTVVNMRCRDRPKLLFDTVCTLTDMQYVVFHATVMVERPEAYQSYWKALSADLAYKPAAECLAIVLTDLGTSLKLAGNTQEGIQKYCEALKIDPHYAPAYYNLGVVYSEMLQYDMTLSCYEKAAIQRLMYAEAYCNMGVMFKNRGDLESTISCYERCLAVSPNFQIAKSNMAIALTDLGTK